MVKKNTLRLRVGEPNSVKYKWTSIVSNTYSGLPVCVSSASPRCGPQTAPPPRFVHAPLTPTVPPSSSPFLASPACF